MIAHGDPDSMGKGEGNGNLIFVHSRCCNVHWELVFDNKTGEYDLRCEKCGKPAGVKVTGPDTGSTCECEACHCTKKD